MTSKLRDILLRPDTAIIDAVRAIDASERQIALVVDGDRRLVGTLTDGDVRRGLLRGVGLEQPVREIMERRPHHVRLEADRSARLQTMRLGGFRHLPLVDGDGRVVGLETLEALLEPEPRDEWVVIMAGGLGKRLRPLTETTPKPMLEVGEVEQVQAILDERYAEDDKKPDRRAYKKDLMRFISLVEQDDEKAELFEEYYIFECTDSKWHTPGEVYLDEPYLQTGLAAYYETLADEADRTALASSYTDMRISNKRLANFAQSVGVITRLESKYVSCYGNPEWAYLRAVPGSRTTMTYIDRDYVIEGLETAFHKPTLPLAGLLWETVCNLPEYPDHLKACYRKSQSRGTRHADTQLVHQLRNTAWVPQGTGSFVRPAEATRDLLPEGFPFDPGWPWIKAVHNRTSTPHQRGSGPSERRWIRNYRCEL